MTRKTRMITAILLAVFLLAGCANISDMPPITTDGGANVEDMYISKVPLMPNTEQTKPTETVEPTIEPVTEPATEPTTAPVTEPVTQPATEPVTEPITQPATEPVTEPATVPSVSPGDALGNETEVLPNGSAAVPVHSATVASGEKVKCNEEATIDYSNTQDGYLMVRYTAETDRRLKVQVKGPTTTYTYNLTPGQWAAFPLSDENGDYQIAVYKSVEGSKYASVLSLSVNVSMEDEFAPFIHSNQYVNLEAAPKTIASAASLAGSIADPLEKVAAIYNFVVCGMTYDTQFAATVTSGYLPDLDSVLAKMSGICFDYAALMTGMLRSQGVPTKLVVGYAGDVYHAWISVWSANTGWVEGVIYFDGVNWQRMDPTFASSGGAGIMDYIGDGTNYSAKYFY